MKKNVVWWTAIVNDELKSKYGNYNYFDISRKTWEYWCERNDVIFVAFTDPVEQDLFEFRPNWQKALFVFDELERLGIDYDQISLMDSSTMIKWNAPNFFELTNRKFTAWRDMDNLKWIYDSVQGYKKFFDNYSLDITKYFSSGLLVFNEDHKELFKSFKDFYYENKEALIEMQDKIVKKGTEQTPFNYWVQMHNVDVNMDLPLAYKLTHLHRRQLLGHNWQLNDDPTPFFIKYGYIWVFNGIPKDTRTDMMNQTWDIVKNNYDQKFIKIDKILDEVDHRDTAKYTTSKKFKRDLLHTFYTDDFRDKTIVELGASQGQSTRVLSHVFKKVIAVEWDDWNLEQARNRCKGRDNVEFVQMDLYNTPWTDSLPKDVDVVFVDAGHEYKHLISDINNSISHFGDPIFIFDDYGLPTGEVKKAIDEKIADGTLQLNKFIGETPDTLVHAAGTKFIDNEGCICNLK